MPAHILLAMGCGRGGRLNYDPRMAAPRRPRQSWFVYLIRCRDGTLYTGVALDVGRRVAEHNAGRGGRYTRGRAPVRVVAASRALDKRAAYRLEWWLKQLRAADKPVALRGAALPPPRRSRPAKARRRARDG